MNAERPEQNGVHRAEDRGVRTDSQRQRTDGQQRERRLTAQRSFGEQIGHLANEHYVLCSPLKGEANPMAKVDFEKTTGKAELVKARDTPFRAMLLNVTHDNEHYGNIITYLRMKGIVPPSSTPTR